MGLDRDVLESLELVVGMAEDLNRDVAEATGDPVVAHAAVLLVLTFLAASGPVDRQRLELLLDVLDVEAEAILGLLFQRDLVESVDRGGDEPDLLALTAAGVELFETTAEAVGGSLARSESLARVRDRHLPH